MYLLLNTPNFIPIQLYSLLYIINPDYSILLHIISMYINYINFMSYLLHVFNDIYLKAIRVFIKLIYNYKFVKNYYTKKLTYF